MKFKAAAGLLAFAGALAFLAASADAQTSQTNKKGTVTYNRDRTVVVTRVLGLPKG